MLQLSKQIPAHRKTEKFRWCKQDFMLYGKFRKARERYRMLCVKQCYWCRRDFQDDDMMALAAPMKGKNRLLCQGCAKEMTDGQ
ncbi:MAG: hypothetical protein AMJ65_08200 [Phycisphaerae bacterium SG8_4]|nr:MAG: hypothetical protein AMJ65_08200 [Phycisphaerae bacterium SG8_4]